MAKHFQVGDTTYEFPDDFTDDKVKLILKGKGLLPEPAIPHDAGIRENTLSDRFRENIGRTVSSFLPMIGGSAGTAIPGADVVTGPLGTATGSALSYGLKKQFPSLFGSVQESPIFGGESTPQEQIAEDVFVNDVAPSGLSAILKKAPGFAHLLEKYRTSQNAEGLEKFIKDPSTGSIPTATTQEVQSAVSNPQTVSLGPDKLLNKIGIGRDTTFNRNVMGQLNRENPGFMQRDISIPGSQTEVSASVGNPARFSDPGQQELNSLIYKGYSPTNKTIDVPKILDSLTKDSKDYANIPQGVQNDLKEFLINVQNQKQLYKGESPYITYDKKRIFYALGSAAVGGNMSGHAVAVPAAMGALILTHDALFKLMDNPTTAHLLINATKKTADASKPLIDKIIFSALAGTKGLYASLPDGEQIPVETDDKGNITPERPSGGFNLFPGR